MTRAEALEVISGCLLGDAGLFKSRHIGNAYFGIALSGEEHIDVLNIIKDALLSLDLCVSDACPKITPRVNRAGHHFQEVSLWSHVNPTLTYLHSIWYSERQKILPKNINLTPLVLAHWYMGDGSSWRMPNKENLVRAKLCTNDFNRDEVERLGLMLSELKIRASLPKCENVLWINDALSVIRLMNIIKPYVVPSYEYRLKWPTLKSVQGLRSS